MGEMADYFIDCMLDQALWEDYQNECWGGRAVTGYAGTSAILGRFRRGDADWNRPGYYCGIHISRMSYGHLSGAVGWLLKHTPTGYRKKVEEIKAEQLRRDFDDD